MLRVLGRARLRRQGVRGVVCACGRRRPYDARWRATAGLPYVISRPWLQPYCQDVRVTPNGVCAYFCLRFRPVHAGDASLDLAAAPLEASSLGCNPMSTSWLVVQFGVFCTSSGLAKGDPSSRRSDGGCQRAASVSVCVPRITCGTHLLLPVQSAVLMRHRVLRCIPRVGVSRLQVPPWRGDVVVRTELVCS